MSLDCCVALPHGAMGCLQFVIVVFPGHNHLLFLYRQIVGIPMGTNCAPLVADLFFFVLL